MSVLLAKYIRNGAWLDAQDFPALRWAGPGLMPEGFGLLTGGPKLGKSWFVVGSAKFDAYASQHSLVVGIDASGSEEVRRCGMRGPGRGAHVLRTAHGSVAVVAG